MTEIEFNSDETPPLKGKLEQLEKINILIGKNGSGKSRALDAIEDAIKKKLPQAPIVRIGSWSQEPIKYFPAQQGSTLRDLGIPIDFTQGNSSPRPSGGRVVGTMNGRHVNLPEDKLPAGLQRVARLYQEINGNINGGLCRYFLIDELENSLHPGALKAFVRWLSKAAQENRDIQFFVATHSPYIASALISSPNAKLYLFKDFYDGSSSDSTFCGPASNRGTHNPEGFKGYSANQALRIVHENLGSHLEDFFGPVFLFGENSIYEFLRHVEAKGGPPIPGYFTVTQGDSKTLEQGEVFRSFTESVNAIKNKTTVGTGGQTAINSFLVIDGPLDNGLQKRAFSEDRQRALRLGTRSDLEGNYECATLNHFTTSKGWAIWDRSKGFNQYLQENSVTGTAKGILKAELCDYVFRKANDAQLRKLIELADTLYANLYNHGETSE